jgi:hypothetical protein
MAGLRRKGKPDRMHQAGLACFRLTVCRLSVIPALYDNRAAANMNPTALEPLESQHTCPSP